MKLLLLLVPSLAFGGSYTFTKRVTLDKLESEYLAAGYLVLQGKSRCNESGCVVHFDDAELKDPAPIVIAHVYDDQAAKKALIIAELKVLAPKLNDNTATAADVRRAVYLILRLLRTEDQ